MTALDLAEVTSASTLGWTPAGCRWLALCARHSTPRLKAIARAALHRAASEGSELATAEIAKLDELDAVPERVER